MKKVVIIGAGIAGLTCGIYSKLNGFDVEIYEMHSLPGGECTGWDRKGYHFDGCIHWLMGSKDGTSLNGLWRTTGAIDDNTRIINHEIFIRYEEDGKVFNLYTDANKLEKHLLEISPEDKREIMKFCKALRALGGFGMPLDKPMDMMTMGDGLKMLGQNLGGMRLMSYYSSLPMDEFAAKFKSMILRRAFRAAIPGDYMANALIMALAGMNEGDSGVPYGGSRAFAQRMAARFEFLGGRIHYKSRVSEIVIENGKAVGIRLEDGGDVPADYVVSCADGYATLYKLLKNKYTPDVYKNLYENPGEYFTPTCAIVFMGVGCRIDGPRALNIDRGAKVSVGGMKTGLTSILNYSYDDTMAPEGKTVMAVYYEAVYDYWEKIYADKEKYGQEKKRLEEDAVAQLVKRYPQADGKIEATDVVTPMTYVRYCGAWRGSWMSWVSGIKGVPRYFPGEVGLNNFLMAGMWTLPPGGLPGAAGSGRFAAHRMCIKEGIEFKSK